MKKPKKLSTSKLKKKLDVVFSQYIRQKYANKEDQVKCYTCPVVKNWKEMQCGHFISRSYLATRFEEKNVRVQCVGCNVFGGGRQVVFASNLDAESPNTVQLLYKKAQEINRYFPYEEKIREYETKINNLQK